MSDQIPSDERRHFSRILFNAKCSLQQNAMEWSSEVLDISMRGILIHKPDHLSLDLQERCEAKIYLSGSEDAITMTLAFAHEENNTLGFRCTHIDIDSLTHLKRLVELNLGNEAMLKRELEALSA